MNQLSWVIFISHQSQKSWKEKFLEFFQLCATTMPLSVRIERCSFKYFSDTKFVYRKIAEILVFASTNIVTHLVQEFAFSQNFSALVLFNFWSASHVFCTSWETEPFVSSKAVTRFDFNFGPIECSFDCASLIYIYFFRDIQSDFNHQHLTRWLIYG